METLPRNVYTCLDQKSKLFEANSIAIGTMEQKDHSKEKSTSENIFHFFTKSHFEKFISRINGGCEMIWKLSYGN